MSAEPQVSATSIPGMYVVDLVIHEDDRGAFTENWTSARLEGLGLPHLDVVQHNVVINHKAGVLRGIHAEPWDKYAAVVRGTALGVVVDLRAGEGFGRYETVELRRGRALLVPQGCGNAYQTTSPDTIYTYLVTDYWRPDQRYVAVDPFDPDLAVPWPMAREDSILSAKDETNPPLRDVSPL